MFCPCLSFKMGETETQLQPISWDTVSTVAARVHFFRRKGLLLTAWGETTGDILSLWVGSFLPGPFLSSPSFLNTETTRHSGSFSSLCDWLSDHWEACHSLLKILFTVKLWYCGVCRIKINFLIKSCNDPPFKALHFVCSLLAAALLVNFFCVYFQFFCVPMIYTHRFSVITNLAFISCWVVYLDLFLVIFCG